MTARQRVGRSIEPATPEDLSWVAAMAGRHREELGFVRRASLEAGIARSELLVCVEQGFCHYHRRRDGWATIYELVSEAGVGRRLLDAIPRPIRLKCPEDLPANAFYLFAGGKHVRTEPGKRRALNVWEWPAP